MSKTEALEKLLSFAFVMSENMVGLTKGNYDEATFVKKTYEYLHKYNVDLKSKLELEKALQYLEVIDGANPSEALEVLDKTISPLLKPILAEYEDDLSDIITANYFALKQALIKVQEKEEDIIHYKGTVENLRRDNALLKEIKNEQEKALKIIFEKNIDIDFLKSADTFEEYNKLIKFKSVFATELTQKEFDLLKRCTNER